MTPDNYLHRLTPSSESLTPEEAQLVAPFFTNVDRSVVALKNLPEVIKGALFSRYSRTAKGVRRLFLDEFLSRAGDALHTPGPAPQREGRAGDALHTPGPAPQREGRAGDALHTPGPAPQRGEVRIGEEKAEAFYQRVLSDYGDDSVAELGGAHLACQEVSQLAAKALEDNRIGLSYLEKSSRYVSFGDRVNGQFRYYRPRRIMNSPFGSAYVETLDQLFETYARYLPRMIDHLAQKYPLESLEFENALTREVIPFPAIRDDDMRRSAQFAYQQAVRARACDALRCFLPMATLTNVGVWGNGRALEYLLIKMYADPLEEIQILAHAAQFELDQVIGPFLKRARDEKGRAFQAFVKDMRLRQYALAHRYLGRAHHPELHTSDPPKVTLVRYDEDAVNQVVASILYPGSNLPKTDILAHVRKFSADEKASIIRAYVGERRNRRHKPGRAFERAMYEFDLLLNIGEYRDLQRHRILSPDRQMFTTALGYEINDELSEVPEIRAGYIEGMEKAAQLYTRIAAEMPFEAQYVVPFGFRVRYNLQLNLREAYHLIELRSSPQGHPDYRRTCQEMFRALQAVHPLLVEAMTFVDLTPDVPIGRLRAEMRRKLKGAPHGSQ